MTGMLNFNFSLCLLSIATFVGAAEISFVGDSKISGELLTIDSEGIVTLNTSYATEPLKINPDGILKIDFGKSSVTQDTPEQNLTLINGDSFPVEVHALDEKVLKINSPSLGDLSVPREIISSLDIGMFSKKLIYKGPEKIDEWSNTRDEVTQWEVEDKSLISNGSDTIYRDMKLPENYAVRFKVKWETVPNLQFSFGDPMDYKGNSVNRYYLQFNRAGMSIRRESTGRQRYYQIALIEREPQEFTSKDLWIEVRVNRKAGRVELYLNDRLQGRYIDSYPDIPSGTGISFYAQAADDNQLSISDIEISEWKDRGDRHRTEDRGNTKEDAVIGKNGERFGGRIISITDGNGGKIYRFKSNFQEDPIDLPDTEVSSIFFTESENIKSEKIKGMRVFFQSRGSIQVSKCVFNGNTISVSHPLLGDIDLNRNVVSRLERGDSVNPNTPKNK